MSTWALLILKGGKVSHHRLYSYMYMVHLPEKTALIFLTLLSECFIFVYILAPAWLWTDKRVTTNRIITMNKNQISRKMVGFFTNRRVRSRAIRALSVATRDIVEWPKLIFNFGRFMQRKIWFFFFFQIINETMIRDKKEIKIWFDRWVHKEN